MSLRLLNGAELILFPHFLSTIQHQCVKSQDATRSFMVVRIREAAEASEVVFSSNQGFQVRFSAIVWPYCGCLCMFFLLTEEQNVFHLWLKPKKVQSNFENQKLLLLKIWFSLGWLNHGPGKAHVLLVYPQRNVLAGKSNIHNKLHPILYIFFHELST